MNARECSILALCLEKIVGLLKDSWLPYWRDREEALRKSHISSFGQLNGCVQMIHTGVCVCVVVVVVVINIGITAPFIGIKGRPRFLIDQDQLEFLRDMQLSWSEIAKLVGISRMTLYRKRIEMELPNAFSEIGDNELVALVSAVKTELPESGERIVAGVLYSHGVRVPRRRVRDAIHTVDPINTSLRWEPRIRR